MGNFLRNTFGEDDSDEADYQHPLDPRLIGGGISPEATLITLGGGTSRNCVSSRIDFRTFRERRPTVLCWSRYEWAFRSVGRIGMSTNFWYVPEKVQGIMAGGETAISDAVEGAEDDRSAGVTSMLKNKIDHRDVVVAIAASGTTPFVLAAVEFAREQGAVTVGLSCNSPSPLLENVDVSIGIPVGPEVLAGSTRLKAGTAQKMVLNMLSTATMVRLGKVYQNRMVDVQTTNKKLIRRAMEMVSELGEVSPGIAAELLQKAGNHVKTAVVMAKLGINPESARKLLEAENGHLGKVLGET